MVMVNFVRKRLQVFVSSTYIDLIPERQAAVEAVLVSGHIPAGMELFTAGDESQMEVIKQWIDESDVYLLILGGRYGSIDTRTGKSYTHLEYEYACEIGKPVFALVVKDEALDNLIKVRGRSSIEQEEPKKLKEFREVVLSRLVRFWSDEKDIKIAIGETLSQIARRDELVGWVKAQDQSDIPALAAEIARLSKENSDLRSQLITKDNVGAVLGIGYEGLQRIMKANNILNKFIESVEAFQQRLGVTESVIDCSSQLLTLGLIERFPDRPTRLRLSAEGIAFNNWHSLRALNFADLAEE